MITFYVLKLIIICFLLLILTNLVFFISNAPASPWTVETVSVSKYFNLTSRAIAVDANGHPHIACGGSSLYYAYYDGDKWHYETVDSIAPQVSEFTDGNSASIALDTLGKVHISYSFYYYDKYNYSSTISIKYATNISGSWKTIDVAESDDTFHYPSTSIAVDTSGKVHISYSDGVYSGKLKYTTNTSGTWTTTTIDSHAGDHNSIAVDTSGNAHISYYDSSNEDLKYATNISGSWTTTTIDSSRIVGDYNSIAVDTSGNVHISYYDYTNDNLKYATNASGTWATATVDNSRGGEYTSIAVDSLGRIHISYNDANNNDVRYATNASDSWETTKVEDLRGGYYDDYCETSIAVDATGRVHICYFDDSEGYLKYATNISGWWETAVVHNIADNIGEDISIALDSSGSVHICYLDQYKSNGRLKYVTNTSDDYWETTIVGSIENIELYYDVSIALDTSGNVHTSYYDETSGDLKYGTNVSGSWETTTIDSKVNIGWSFSIAVAVDTSGKVHISYFDYTNRSIKYATNTNGSWMTTIIATASDSDYEPFYANTSIASDNQGKAHICYFFEGDALKYAKNTSGSWVTTLVDNNAMLEEDSKISIAVDSSGKAHISCASGDLEYATNIQGSWKIITVDDKDSFDSASIVVDTSDKVHISYHSRYIGMIKHATNASGSWKTSVVDCREVGGGYTIPNAIAVDKSGDVHVAYRYFGKYGIIYATNADSTTISKQECKPKNISHNVPGKELVLYSDNYDNYQKITVTVTGDNGCLSGFATVVTKVKGGKKGTITVEPESSKTDSNGVVGFVIFVHKEKTGTAKIEFEVSGVETPLKTTLKVRVKKQ